MDFILLNNKIMTKQHYINLRVKSGKFLYVLFVFCRCCFCLLYCNFLILYVCVYYRLTLDVGKRLANLQLGV